MHVMLQAGNQQPKDNSTAYIVQFPYEPKYTDELALALGDEVAVSQVGVSQAVAFTSLFRYFADALFCSGRMAAGGLAALR